MTTPHDPTRGMHRSDGHDTSREAAQAVLGKKTALQRIVLAKFLEAGERGLTLYELEDLCNDHSSTMRTRCSELVGQGLLIDSGTKRVVNGRKRKVWRIRTAADAEAGDLIDLMLGGRVDPLMALLGRGFQSAFGDVAEIEAYVQINGFRLVGHNGAARVYKTVKGHRLAFDPTTTPILASLSYEAPETNVTDVPGAGPRITGDDAVSN